MCPVISRVYLNNILFTDKSNKSKYCDFFVYDKKNKMYGIINNIVFLENNSFAIIQRYLFQKNFLDIKFSELNLNIFYCTPAELFFINNIEYLDKCFLYKISENLFYVNDFKMNHLFT